MSNDVHGKTALSSQVGGDHYKHDKIQWVEFVHANKLPAIEAIAIKYLMRWRKKNGIEDLRKAIHYIQLLIELEEKLNKEGLGHHGGRRPGSGRPVGIKNKHDESTL